MQKEGDPGAEESLSVQSARHAKAKVCVLTPSSRVEGWVRLCVPVIPELESRHWKITGTSMTSQSSALVNSRLRERSLKLK